MESDYEKCSPWQRNFTKIDKRKEELGLLYNRQQSWNPKQAITLKHLITYINLRTYINPKNMIGMLVTDHHVWGHAYGHDKTIIWITIYWAFKKTLPNFWIFVFASILFAMHFLLIECTSNVIDLSIFVIYDVPYAAITYGSKIN